MFSLSHEALRGLKEIPLCANIEEPFSGRTIYEYSVFVDFASSFNIISAIDIAHSLTKVDNQSK